MTRERAVAAMQQLALTAVPQSAPGPQTSVPLSTEEHLPSEAADALQQQMHMWAQQHQQMHMWAQQQAVQMWTQQGLSMGEAAGSQHICIKYLGYQHVQHIGA